MRRKRLTIVTAVVASLLSLAGLAYASGASSGHAPGLASAIAGTAQYQDVALAVHDGYAEFRDVHGIACIAQPGLGGMGIHYVKGSLVGDTVLDPASPEALVYEPGSHGRLRLVAVEYIVFQDAWDAANSEPPSLFGQVFDLTPSPNRFGIPAFYALHAWIWKKNPSGLFAPWNPRVVCD